MIRLPETPFVMTREFQLLLACASRGPAPEAQDAARRILLENIDWTAFVQKAMAHGLAGLAGHTLALLVPDMVPDEILDAFRVKLRRIGERNRALFDELVRVIDALAEKGIDAIPFKGPILAMQAYGDLDLREFRDLDFLIRDQDMSPAMATLHSLGYARKGQFTAAQIEMIQRLQGQEIVFHQTARICIEPHTRLTPLKMTLDIDYAGLWGRARRADICGHAMLAAAPEDQFLILAIHGGKEMWWRMNWACDVAAFIASHPNLDWSAIIERARAQGCLRMVLLAASLARRYFNAPVPDSVASEERADPVAESMAQRIVKQWLAYEAGGPPSNNKLSLGRLLLHDGIVRRARYVARTWFLPGPHHVGAFALPRSLRFGYVPIKLVHDLAMLPAWRIYRAVFPRRPKSAPGDGKA
jgi:putative nucleotidyltransferase-like protein